MPVRITDQLNFLRVIRNLDPVIPTQQVEILLLVAQWPGISSTELATHSGQAQSSISRNTAALAQWHRLKRPGLDLIESIDDPRERRRRLFFLTPHGRKVVPSMMKCVDPEFILNSKTAPTAKEWVNNLHRSYQSAERSA